MITKQDLQEVIEGWKIKFQKLTEGVRAIQIATEATEAMTAANVLRTRTDTGTAATSNTHRPTTTVAG